MSGSSEPADDEESFDDKEFLSTKPPPADVHNASTAVANLPPTLLDSLRSPHTRLDSAAISELLLSSMTAAVSAEPEEEDMGAPVLSTAASMVTSDELANLPLLGEPELPLDDVPLIMMDDDDEMVATSPNHWPPPPTPTTFPFQPFPPAAGQGEAKPTVKALVLVTIALTAALGLVGTGTWVVVGFFN